MQNTLTADPHAGADQQPDPPAPERSADADEPGAQPGQPAVQRGRPVAREPGDHPALHRQAQGIAYDVTSIDREFARLYPGQYAATVSGDQMYRDAQERWKNTWAACRTTMQMQAGVAEPGDDEGACWPMSAWSRASRREGALQAMQAGNQLLALQAKQSDPDAAAPDHAGPGRFAEAGTCRRGHRAGRRGSAPLPHAGHGLPAAVRQFLQPMFNGHGRTRAMFIS